MDLEYKSINFEIKEIDDKGHFTGIASPYDNVDLGGDRVRKSISKRNANKVVPYLWSHDTHEPIGTVKLIPTNTGINIDGQLFLDLSTSGTPLVPNAFKAYTSMKNGILSNSIGYNVMDGGANYVTEGKQTIRDLLDIDIKEVSGVLFPMNEAAKISDVKSQEMEGDNLDGLEEKGVSGSTTLPMADKTVKWDGNAAAKRVLDKYTDDKGNIGADAKKAFFYFDETKPNNKTSYKFGFADIVNDTLTAVPAGILACANALRGARNASTLDMNIKKGIAKKVNTYLKKLKYAEVQESEIKAGENILEVKENTNLEEKAMSFADILKAQQANDMRWKLQDALNDGFRQLMNDDTMTSDQKIAQLNQNVDAFSTAYKEAMTLLLQASTKNKTAKKQINEIIETKELTEMKTLETKAGKKISKANKTKLSQCKDMMGDLMSIIAAMCEEPDDEMEDDKGCGGKTTKKTEGKMPPADPKQTGKEPPIDPEKPSKQEKSNDGTLEIKSALEQFYKTMKNKGDE